MLNYYFIKFVNEVLKMKVDTANGAENGITNGQLNQSVSQPANETENRC
jgi:hypothetical protein